MIKLNELRKGSLIYLEVGLPGLNLHKIKGQDIADIENGRITLNVLNPIPLTPEWLERMNCYELSGFWFPYGEGSPKHQLYWAEDFIVKIVDPAGYVISLAENIQYVHQLQNLYFAITGNELTIKEPA